jgi:hypothetical protein
MGDRLAGFGSTAECLPDMVAQDTPEEVTP